MVVKDFKKAVEENHGTLMPVHAIPQGKKFAVIGFDEWTKALKVRLKAKAEKGKANQELVKELRKIFNAEVEILSGKTQRKKTLLIHASKSRVKKRLSSLLRQKA